MNIIPVGASESDRVRAQQAINSSLEGNLYGHLEKIIVEGSDIEETILAQSAEECDLIVIGASGETPFRKLVFGNIPDGIAKNAKVTVIIVKRRSGRLQSFVHENLQ